MENIDSEKLICVKEVSAKIGCCPRQFARLADSGRAPWGCKIGRMRRWRLAEIDAWILAGCCPMGVKNESTR